MLGKEYCKNIVNGTKELISTFKKLNKKVWILTGNFQPAVGILVKKLGIPNKHVVCNKIFFDSNGKYKGFDEDSPLTHNGGKIEKIRQIKKLGFKKIIYVGDGATDLEVKKYVSLFIGFGGVVEREIVRKNSDIYINHQSFRTLINIFNKPSITPGG